MPVTPEDIAELAHLPHARLRLPNLGSLVAAVPYDSDALAGALTAIMTGHAARQSAEIAANIDAFPGYLDALCPCPSPQEDNVASMLSVIRLHRDEVENIHPAKSSVL
jgi:ribonucleoside-diphosphate reductase alpha chain